MAKQFSELRAAMSTEAQDLSLKKSREMLDEMPLNELRQARGLSQEMVATILGIGQPSVAKFETRVDMYVSTLRSHIKAMGGDLIVVAKFPDGEVVITNFSESKKVKHIRKKDLQHSELVELSRNP